MQNIANQILCGDALSALKTLPDESVHMSVNSPPYFGLRDYGSAGQIGLEQLPLEYIDNLVGIYREVRRVLRDDGTLWVVIGDSYAGSHKGATKTDKRKKSKQTYLYGNDNPCVHLPTRWDGIKPKDMIGIPWAFAFAMRTDGWHLRSCIVWHKTNPLPEGVKDRPSRSYEFLFMFAKSPKYYFDYKAIQEPVKQSTIERAKNAVGENKYTEGAPGQPPQRLYQPRGRGEIKAPEWCRKRDVWTTATSSYRGAHFATYPVELITPCILAGCPEGGIVLDPFFGSGTTGVAAIRNNRQYVGIEINPDFCELARERIAKEQAKR